MKKRETEMLALGEEEATRLETRPRETCDVQACEYRTGEGLCGYYEATGSIRPCVAGEGCHFAGGSGAAVKPYRKGSDNGPDVRQTLYDQGLTGQEIAERSGYSIHTVRYWRHSNGLAAHGAGEKNPKKSEEKLKKPEEKPKKPEEKPKKPEEKPKKPEEKPQTPVTPESGRYFRVMLADGTEVRTRGIGIAASVQTVGVLDGDDMVAWFPSETVRGIYAEAEA